MPLKINLLHFLSNLFFLSEDLILYDLRDTNTVSSLSLFESASSTSLGVLL